LAYQVLLVDDDDDNRFMFSQLVLGLECDVHQAGSGPEAEEVAKAKTPNLVLLDVMMPGQNGYETCRNMRRDGFKGKVILLSALPVEVGQNRAKDCGANGYLQKPVTREVLKRFLDAAKSEQEASQ
jgi:CheY-like chemotaxis protein